MIIFTYVFYPFIWVLNAASNGLLRLTGVKISPGAQGSMPHTEEELRGLLAQSVAEGTIAKGNEKILTSAFDFGDLKVRQIMKPRTEVDYLTLDQPIGEVLKIVQRSNFTRLPLCDGDIDHVIGLVHMKDLFNHLKLTPGKLRFVDERTPEGELIAIPTGFPGSAVHVIGSGELKLDKIKRVAAREVDGAPHDVLLVLDATVGQNGVQQAREFMKVSGVNGIILTKLDGTAKGGVAVAIAQDLRLPIRYVGTGEQIDDLVPFNPREYVDALFEEAW